MITLETIMEQLTGGKIAAELIQYMVDQSEDFATAKERYDNAMQTLRNELGTEFAPLIAEAEQAIETQMISGLLYSSFLGIKGNLENFVNPVSRNFLEVDPDRYLHTSTAHTLPAFIKGEHMLERFFASVPSAYDSQCEDIRDYISFLETICPKLAHYYGYLLGNSILCWIIPGYHADMAQTIQYRIMLRQYLGVDFSSIIY